MMRVLVACEFSGVVREAFRRRGHEAWSCDLLAADDGSQYHLRCNATYVLKPADDSTYYRGLPWDLLIAHPPCTYLANSGVRWLYKAGKGATRNDDRWLQLIKGAQFFAQLLNAPIPRVAVENPVIHRYAREIIGSEPTQIVHPWQFGHPETKATCLWLRNLPPLQPTRIVDGRKPRVHHESPGPDRWKRRSITYQGIADAMAEQWGGLE